MAEQRASFDDETARRFADEAARMLELTIAPEWMPAVVQNLKTNAAVAQLVLSFPLDDETDSTAVFRV